MKNLKDILEGVEVLSVQGSVDKSINALSLNSLAVGANDLFVAIKGFSVDGHQYIDSAISNGANTIVCETFPQEIKKEVCYLQVANSSKTIAVMASNFFGNPSKKLKLVAITGTNGKTSVATLLYKLYGKLGYKVGLLSTVENKIGEKTLSATHTTPNAIALNALLSQMVAEGCDYAFMEASSHAIHQNRVFGLAFDGAVFLNLTHDHLDYHKTFKKYLNTKKVLFDNLPKTAFALTNADEKNGMVMLQNTKAKKYKYALKSEADFKIKIMETDFSGMLLTINGTAIHSPLIGGFNAYNLLSVYSVAMLLGADKNDVLITLSTLKGAEGRFEYQLSAKESIVAIVDYAHTPDALKNVLETIKGISKKTQKIITVVGCGGDRDKAKRPIMAQVACKWSNRVVLTSDNPRTENPDTIITEMQAGIAEEYQAKVVAISNRAEAIKTACIIAEPNDIILIAGKGHEKYQEINGVKHAFDDKEKVKEIFKQLNK